MLPWPLLPLWLLPCSLAFIQSLACYSCSVCATSVWAAFPAALYCVCIALKQLWFLSALLSLLSCWSTFWALLRSGLKHYLLLSLSSATTSSWQRRAALKLLPKWTGAWSRSWEAEHKPSCRQNPLGVGAYWQVKTGVEAMFYLLIKSAGVWQ